VTPVVAEELQELLLAWEEALATQEEKVRILVKALTKVRVDLNAERAKAEATRKSTTTRSRLTLLAPSTPSIRC
jgi:hypothetical protein